MNGLGIGPADAISDTVALVLAGGRGERLQSLTDFQAKPGLPFGGKFRLIDFPLSNCINSGIRRISVATQYCAHALIQHVQRTWGFLHAEMGEFVEVWPAQQQLHQRGWYAGTADAVFQNMALLRSHRPKYVLILAGDHIYKQNYRALIADHIRSGAEVTVSCIDVPAAESGRFGIMCSDPDGYITDFLEKPAALPPSLAGPTCLASMGVYVFNADVLYDALAADATLSTSRHDFGIDLIPALVEQGKVFAHRFTDSCVQLKNENAYWRDVGTVDAFWQANLDLIGKSPFDLYDGQWPIWTQHDQQPPARIVDDGGVRSSVSNSLLSSGCLVSGSTISGSVIFTDTHIGPGSEIMDSVVLPGCRIGAGVRVSKAILAEGCHVPAGSVIGADNPAFERSAGGVVVVTPAMLDRLSALRIAKPRRLPVPIAQVTPLRPAANPRGIRAPQYPADGREQHPRSELASPLPKPAFR